VGTPTPCGRWLSQPVFLFAATFSERRQRHRIPVLTVIGHRSARPMNPGGDAIIKKFCKISDQRRRRDFVGVTLGVTV